MELGDPEPAGERAVAVVVERQERLGLRGPGLPAEQDRLVPVGQVEVEAGEHPPRRLPQPLGVHRPPPVRVPARSPWPPATPPPRATCSAVASTGACSAAFTITRTCSTRSAPAANASRVAAYLSCSSPASRNPPAACSRVDPVNRATHASVPVSAVCLGHPPPVGLRRQRQPQRRGPRLHPSQHGDHRAQRARRPATPPGRPARVRSSAASATSARQRGSTAGDPATGRAAARAHTRMVSNTCSSTQPLRDLVEEATPPSAKSAARGR